jgi:hypothetical protein
MPVIETARRIGQNPLEVLRHILLQEKPLPTSRVA